MSSDAKQPLERAMEVCQAFYDLFPPETYIRDRFKVAGSVRRKRPEVGDIEFVIIPKTAKRNTVPPGELFPRETTVNLLFEHVDKLVDEGTLKRAKYPDGRERWGDKHRGVEFMGFKVEIYTADENNWGNMFSIRTGPAMYSKNLVTTLKRTGRVQRDGYLWNEDGSLQPCRTEHEFFKFCRVRWVHPVKRVDPEPF